ncbi:MAG: phage BR0599 family protein, partial [Marivita lacus]|nr:phage BR0599 family protein [Marivita lacus]
YQAPCLAVLGDATCGVDSEASGMWAEAVVTSVTAKGGLILSGASGFETQWFQRGRLTVLDGTAEGLWAVIKRDVLFEDGARQIELWEPLRAVVAVGDRVGLIVGCDKRFETCRAKFDNVVNFQGFPDIPQEEWVLIPPSSARSRGGGSLR